MTATAALLSAQAQGGIDGANAYIQAQAEIAARKKAAVDAALAEAQGRGTPTAALGQTAQQVGDPYAMADLAMTQSAADYNGDMARRTSRWNEYAHDVDSARKLVGDVAKGKSDIIDAQTRAQLALLEAQKRASSRSSGGGGGGGGKSEKQLTKGELQSYLGVTAANNMAGRQQSAVDEQREVGRFATRSQASLGAQMAFPKAQPGVVEKRIAQDFTAPNSARQRAIAAALGMRMASTDFTERGNRLRETGTNQQADLYDIGAKELQQFANRTEAGAPMPRMNPSQIRMADEQARKSTVPGFAKMEAAMAALNRQIRDGKRQAGENVDARSQQMMSPQALSDEMVNVAATDPMLAGRFTPFDLAEIVQPKVNTGESASDFLYRINGGPTQSEISRSNRDQAQALDDQEQAAADQWSNQLGFDVEALAQSADVPWDTMVTMLTQDADVQAAIDQLQGSFASVKPEDMNDLLLQTRSQLDPVQFAVVKAYLGL